MTIEQIYQEALFAAAAYSDWDNHNNLDQKLLDLGFTETQIEAFKTKFTVEDEVEFFDSDTNSGFSAVVFRNNDTQEITVSFRGTDNSNDWLTNIPAILGVNDTSDFFNDGQENNITKFLDQAGLLENQGVRVLESRTNV